MTTIIINIIKDGILYISFNPTLSNLPIFNIYTNIKLFINSQLESEIIDISIETTLVLIGILRIYAPTIIKAILPSTVCTPNTIGNNLIRYIEIDKIIVASAINFLEMVLLQNICAIITI